MLNVNDILETIKMIDEDCLDVRTITMGISLLDCADSDIDRSCEKVYNKITRLAKDLVKTGEMCGEYRRYCTILQERGQELSNSVFQFPEECPCAHIRRHRKVHGLSLIHI